MEVDEEHANSRTANIDDNEGNNSFQTLLKSIKSLEKQSKTKEQQLTNKLEQERLQWEREKQELLEQLRQRPSPYKVPRSPARPVLGARSPNKQPVSAATTRSQAPSDISFQDIFSPTNSTSKGPNSSRQAKNNTHTTPSKRHVPINGSISPSHRKLQEELDKTQKELKRVKHRYYALYEANEEIVRKRNKDRDRWRHFKLVVKHVCAERPEFQDALKEADTYLKTEQGKQKGPEDDAVQKTPTKTPSETASKMEKAPTSTTENAPVSKHAGNTSSRASSHQQKKNVTASTSRNPLRTPERRSTIPPPTQPVLSPRPLSSPPQSPSPKKRSTFISHSQPSRSTKGRPPNRSAYSQPVQGNYDHLSASQSTCLNSSAYSTPAEERPEPVPPSSRASSGTREVPVFNENLVDEADEEEAIDYDFELPWDLIRRHELDDLFGAALEDADMEAELAAEQEAALAQALEEEQDRQVLDRIYAEYATTTGPSIALQGPNSAAAWKLDGKEIEGPVLPVISETVGTDAQALERGPARPSPPFSLPSTCDNLSFWSQEQRAARTASQQSVPTDIDVESYVPSFEGPLSGNPAVQPTRGSQPVATSLVSVSTRTIPATESYSESQSQAPPYRPIHSPYFDSQPTAVLHTNAIPYLYPLPQDLQPHISPDVDMLEESMPVHRKNRPRIRNSSILTPTSASRERTEKPLKEPSHPPRPPIPRSYTCRQAANAATAESPDDEATESSSECSQEANQTVKQDHLRLEKSVRKETDQVMPSSSAAVTSSTVKSRSNTTTSSKSPDHDPSVDESAGDVEMDDTDLSNEVAGPSVETDVQASQVMRTTTRSVAIKAGSLLPRLSSYRAARHSDSDGESATRSISDGRIGPRKVPAATAATRPAAALTMAGRAVGLPEEPKEDLCEALYHKITAGLQPSQSNAAPTPLGKAIVPQQKLPLSGIPRGTPSAWMNMSSKKRNTSFGTPTQSAPASSFKRAQEISKVSDTVQIGQASVLVGDGTTIDKTRSKHKSVRSILATEVRKEERDSPSLRGKRQASPSSPRLTASEMAAGFKKSAIKKARKRALIADPDVQSDLDVIGAAILKGDGSSFRLGIKRPAQHLVVPPDEPARKKSRNSGEIQEASHNDAENPRAEEGPDFNKYNKKTASTASTKSISRRSAAEKVFGKSAAPILQQKLTHVSTSTHVKQEENESDTLEDESEEYKGQLFLRNIHKMRNQELAKKLASRNGRNHDDDDTELRDGHRAEVAYKETVRNREARQKMHGVDCDCCKGYYEYKTRNMPLEQRQQAASEMANDVSRHRQNHETAESPPGFWQMGFPSTQEVERINQEAEKMVTEKKEKQRKEEKDRRNQCEGRFAYKVV